MELRKASIIHMTHVNQKFIPLKITNKITNTNMDEMAPLKNNLDIKISLLD